MASSQKVFIIIAAALCKQNVGITDCIQILETLLGKGGTSETAPWIVPPPPQEMEVPMETQDRRGRPLPADLLSRTALS